MTSNCDRVFFSRFVEIVFSFLKLLRLYFQADTRAHGIAISNREMILLNFNTNNSSGEFYLFIQHKNGRGLSWLSWTFAWQKGASAVHTIKIKGTPMHVIRVPFNQPYYRLPWMRLCSLIDIARHHVQHSATYHCCCWSCKRFESVTWQFQTKDKEIDIWSLLL